MAATKPTEIELTDCDTNGIDSSADKISATLRLIIEHLAKQAEYGMIPICEIEDKYIPALSLVLDEFDFWKAVVKKLCKEAVEEA